MAWLFIVFGAVAVVAIGLVIVGRVTAELAAKPPVSTVDLDEAVLWVGDRLPSATTAEISYDDVRVVLGWYLDYMTDKGVARPNDAVPATSGPLVADEDEALAFVLGRLAAAGDDAPPVTDAQVVEICDVQREYLMTIGAVRSIDATD